MSLGKSKLDKSNSYKQLQANPSLSKFGKIPNQLISSSSNGRLPQGQLNLVVRSRSKDTVGKKSTFKLYVGSQKDGLTPKSQITNNQNQSSLKSSRKENMNPNNPTQNKAVKGKTFKEVRLAVSKPNTMKPKAQIKKELVSKAEQIPSIALYIPSGIKQFFKKAVLDDFVILRQTQEEQHSNEYLAMHSKLNWLFTIKKFNKNVIVEHQLLDQLVESLKIHFYLTNLESQTSTQQIYTIFCDTTAVYLVLEPICNNQYESICGSADQTIKGFNKMLSALAIIHQNRIVLRNLTTRSIKNQMGVLKITNIVRATALRQDRRRQSFFGSLHQTPHQLIIGQSYDTSYDMWSIGLFLYQSMLKLSPFSEITGMEQIKSLQFKLPIELPNGLALAISCLLCQKQRRLSAQQCLRAEYFKGQGKDYNLVNRDIYNFWMFQ